MLYSRLVVMALILERRHGVGHGFGIKQKANRCLCLYMATSQ
jgi:hypothetical protein